MPRVNVHKKRFDPKKPTIEKPSSMARSATPARIVKRAERLLIQGNLSLVEIVKGTGVGKGKLSRIQADLVKRGIQTKIPSTHHPPQKVAMAAVRFEALLQITGQAPSGCALKAEAHREASVTSWLSRKKHGVFSEIRVFRGGLFWDRAVKEVTPWIRSLEEEYKNRGGKKFDPNLSLSTALKRNPKGKKRNN